MLKDFAILKDRSLLMFFSARSISLLGNAMAPVALAFAVLDMRGGSATTLGLVLTARVVAQVVFVLIGGVVADRFPRQQVMVAADLAAGVTQAVAAALVITGIARPLVLAALVVVSGAAAAMFAPASRSVMPQLVSGETLQSANGLLQLSLRGGNIIGAALAGVLVAVLGPGPTLLIDAATFLVSMALISGIRLRHGVSQSAGGTLLRQLRDGWREFAGRRWVWQTVAQLSFVNLLLAGGFFVLGPVVAKQSLGGAPAWGAILTAQAVGFVTGSALAIRVRPRHPVRTAALVVMGFPLPLFLLAAHAPVAAVCALAFVTGMCVDLYGVLIDTTLQKRIPSAALSRVMSYESVGSMALVPLGSALAGPVSVAVGIGPALVGTGVLMVLAGPVLLLSGTIRHIEDVPRVDQDATPMPAQGSTS